MATLAEPQQDYSILPELPADVFTAPLKKPAHVGDDWLEPAQTVYTSEDHQVWDDLFARQMEVLPGRAATTQNLAAYDLYLRARERQRRRVPPPWTDASALPTVLGPATTAAQFECARAGR